MSISKSEPKWLTYFHVMMLHAESLKLFGGSVGIRDQGLLESALDRPRNRWHYEQSTTVFELAAAYGFGIARNHAFVDGNKRTSLLAMRAFLYSNGYHFSPDEVETVTTIEGLAEGLAEGRVDEVLLARWIEDNSSKRV